MNNEISDLELSEFCQWFKQHYGKDEAFECVVLVSMSGHFHTTPRKARKLLERCKCIHIVESKRNVIYLK